MKKAQNSIRLRAIHGGWQIARHFGVAAKASDPPSTCLMSTNQSVRAAIVRAWEVGYSAGKKDAEKGGGKE